MRVKRMMLHGLIRPADAFLPAGLFIAAMFTPQIIMVLFCAYTLGVTALSLASCRGLRIAFAVQPSIRSVRGSVKTAIAAQLCATAVACALLKLLDPTFDVYKWLLTGMGLLMNIEHTFYEYLFATGDRGSATLSRAITTVIVSAGLILCGTYDGDIGLLVGAAGISAAVSAVVGLAIGGALKGRWNAQVLRCAPRALLQTLLYPVAAVALWRFGPFSTPIAPLFAGLALYELVKTPFRRADMESREFNRALLAGCALGIAAIAAGLIPAIRSLAGDSILLSGIMLILAALCAFILFGRVGRQPEE